VSGDICSICCGTEREVTVDCPLDCPHLQEAHAHEKMLRIDRDSAPNADVEVSDGFLHQHQELMVFAGFALARAASKAPGAVDSDLRDALDALTQTYRTLSKGLYYEARPTNPYAARIVTVMQEGLQEYREDLKLEGKPPLDDLDLLRVLVMYQRLGLTYNNSRPKGRPFLGFLLGQFPPAPEQKEEPRLIQL
jgi:hypothetical protein